MSGIYTTNTTRSRPGRGDSAGEKKLFIEATAHTRSLDAVCASNDDEMCVCKIALTYPVPIVEASRSSSVPQEEGPSGCRGLLARKTNGSWRFSAQMGRERSNRYGGVKTSRQLMGWMDQ